VFNDDDEKRDDQGRTRLHEAAMSGDLQRVRDLLASHRVCVNAEDVEKCTPLMLASTHEVVSVL